MSKELLISSTSLETKLAIIEDDQVTEVFIERAKNQGILGNIYKGKVTRVLPGMQAAFVNIGLDRDAFLYVSDFFENYEEYEELFAEGQSPFSRFDGETEIGVGEEGSRAGRGKRSRRSVHRSGRRRGESSDRGRGGRPAPEGARPASAQDPEGIFESARDEGRLRAGEFAAGRAEEAAEAPHREPVPPLPEHPETVVEFDPEPLPADDLPDDEARLRGKSHLQHLRMPRGRRRSPDGRNDQSQIADLLREGQEILVQVAKEPIGKKGARITSHVALPGRHLVYMPTVEHVGVSRRIVDEQERQRLKTLVHQLRGDTSRGFIVRTVGEGQGEEEFRQDMAYLMKLWEDIRTKAETLSAPVLIHSEPTLVPRVVRDHFSDQFRAIRIDDEQAYERVVDFVSKFNPELVNRVRLYNKGVPLFDAYDVSTELEKSLRPKVWLKNGGYIVINQTEALVAIDVNTGKFVGSTNSLEDTITKTNLDAVKEVVRQIRLRDLGGIIIIDFIDMDERKNRQKVMEMLQQELAKDKSPSKVLQFNEFGLVTITRKRVKQSLERLLCQPCRYCHGTGVTKSVRTVCYSIHREVRRMLFDLGEGQEILIRCHPDVGKALRNGERIVLQEIEEMTRKTVSIKADPLMHIEQFDLVEI